MFGTGLDPTFAGPPDTVGAYLLSEFALTHVGTALAGCALLITGIFYGTCVVPGVFTGIGAAYVIESSRGIGVVAIADIHIAVLCASHFIAPATGGEDGNKQKNAEEMKT